MKKLIIILVTAILAHPALCLGKERPLWEIGVGLASFYLPDYRGSDVSRGYLVPVPYITYQGKILRAERSNVKGQILESERLKLDISLGGGVPVNSEDNEARAGMPDLDPTGELGPSLELKLWRQAPPGRSSLWLKLPLRGVFAVSSSGISYHGWKFAPFLNYQWGSEVPSEWKVTLSLGPVFSSKRHNDYFYEVKSIFATPERPEFHPKGGFSGSRVTLTVEKRFGELWLGGFARYDTLSNAIFKNSPLVKTSEYLAIGLAVAWIAAKSKTRISIHP